MNAKEIAEGCARILGYEKLPLLKVGSKKVQRYHCKEKGSFDYSPSENERQFFELVEKFCDNKEWMFNLEYDRANLGEQATYQFTLSDYHTDVFIVEAPTLKELMPKVCEEILKREDS